jgi:phosphoribosylaminoimidazole-succinocarboxamide synthase
LLGKDLAQQIKDVSLALYQFAADYVLERGIIIADTKFECFYFSSNFNVVFVGFFLKR